MPSIASKLSTTPAYRMTRRILGLTVVVLALAAAVSAQTATSVIVKVIAQGVTLPPITTTLPFSAFVCGQTPKVPAAVGAVINPRRIVIDDPANVLADCIYTDPGTGPLLSLPFGAQPYAVVAVLANAAGNSPDSLASNPFTRPGTVAPVPTGVRVVP